MLISQEIGETLADSEVPHFVGHTYSGNPLSTGVACPVIDVIEQQIGMDEIAGKGGYLGDLLRQQLLEPGFVADVRGQSLLWAVETGSSAGEQARSSKPDVGWASTSTLAAPPAPAERRWHPFSLRR